MSERLRFGSRTRCCAVLLAVATSVAMAVGPASAADGGWDGPDDVPAPTAAQLAASIHAFELTPPKSFSTDGAIHTIEDTTKDGAETVITLASDILFATSEFALPPGAAGTLGEIVAPVPQGAAVSVVGHTDSVGDDASNQVLSEQRASSVAQALAAARPDLVLTVAGQGERAPVASETSGGAIDPAGRAQNRRVEIRFAS